MDNLIPLSETVHAEKSRDHDAKIQSSTATIMESNQAIIDNQLSESLEQRKATQFYRSSSSTGARSIVERHQMRAEATLDALCESVGNITLAACWIDDGVKEANRDSIMESSAALLKGLISKGIVTVEAFQNSKAPAVHDIFSNCLAIGEAAVHTTDEGNVVVESEDDIFAEDTLTEGENAVATKVRAKVKKMIGDEKEIAQANKDELEDLQEGRRITAPTSAKTLWRSLVEFNSTQIAVTEGESNVSDHIMGEAMIQYTFMEALNTMGVLEMNASAIQEMCRNLSYKGSAK